MHCKALKFRPQTTYFRVRTECTILHKLYRRAMTGEVRVTPGDRASQSLDVPTFLLSLFHLTDLCTCVILCYVSLDSTYLLTGDPIEFLPDSRILV